MRNIVLIDDVQKTLDELRDAIASAQGRRDFEIRCWLPSAQGGPAFESFNGVVDEDTVVVITDYDLTGAGQTGLFGSTIVDWCNRKLIPVGDYSRANKVHLPKEPNQYEIRIPQGTAEAAAFVISLFDGFTAIQSSLEGRWDVLGKKRSPAAILADILERPLEESRLALYGIKIGAPNSALMESISQNENADTEKRRFIAYIIGHLLLNVVIRFPGPIVDCQSLAAFLAIAQSELPEVEDLFKKAVYRGPFVTAEPLYWLTDIEDILDSMHDGVDTDPVASVGKVNRSVLEYALGKKLKTHNCPRCHGDEGGFICAFTKKTVCQRSDCSVASNAWIPQGARLCRIEKVYYDEWAPMLGF